MTTLQITFVSEDASYQNTLGWYNTRTGEAGIIFLNTNDDGPNAAIAPGDTAYLEVEQSDLDAGYIGFFLIPNGALRYGTGADSVLHGPLSFDTKGNGDGKILDANGNNLNGAQGEIIFSDPALNKKDVDYTKGDDDANGILGQIAFEDLVKKSDRDFNDLVIDVQVVQPNLPPNIETQTFHIDENSGAGTVVDQVTASDPEGGPLSYAITGGNESGTFEINAGTGLITVAEGGVIDFETLSGYTLTVQVTDSGGLSRTAEVQINVNNVLETLAGRALDGYIAGATVFADQDGDGNLDAGEVSAMTDASGNFALVDGIGPLVMFGGTDVTTGLAFSGVLRAPAGSTVVTPLTTLIAELVNAGQSPAAATANVSSAFGLDASIDLLNFDPIPAAAAGGPEGAAAAQVLAAGVQVQNTLVQIGALLSGAGGTNTHAAVVAALAGLTASGAPVDLTDAASAQALIAAAAAASGVAPEAIDAVAGDAALVLAATNAAAANAVAGGGGIAALEALAQAAAVAQSTALAEALGQAGAANAPGTLVQEYTGQNLATRIAEATIGDIDGGTVGTPGDDVLVGTPGNDLIDGLAGNDLLQGLEGNDRLLGGEGDDVLEGGLGNDFLRGGPGNDVLNGGVLADFQSDIGFRDTDRADYSRAAAGVVVNLATGQASDGDGGTDTLIGIESVTGSAHDDALTGSSAFSENWRGGGGNDSIDGGGGFDRAEYVDATSGVSISLGGLGGTSSAAGTASGAAVGTDTLLNVESFVGSDFDDTYVAGLFVSASLPGGFFSTFNSFEGRGGNDVITGNGATRVEYTNATGGVTVNLNLGFATGDSSVGTDSFTGVSDVRGSSFADMLIGGNVAFNGFEGYDGRGGDDTIDGGQGWDRADYAFNGAASSGIHVQLAAGIVTGDPLVHGTDTLRGIEAIRGTHLDDLYDATGFSEDSTNAGWSGTLNEFSGMAGNDTIIGNGNTRIGYTLAREGIAANLALGTVVGGASVGVDTVSGVSEVFGTNFDDTLRGTSGNEVLLGLSGNDLLVGGAGNDRLDGGGGIDRVDYSGSSGGVFVDLLFNTANDGMGGTDTLFGIEEVVGTAFNDTLYGDWANNVLAGGMGHDILRGGGGNDVLHGGIVADFQSDAGFRDTDRADYSTAFMGVVVNLAAGTASDGEGGFDTLSGFEGVIGSMHGDSITGSDAFSQFFRGGAGDDFIDGAGGNDQAEYWDATGAITVNLGFAGDASGTVSGDFSVGFDTLVNVERIVGSNFADGYFVGAFVSASGPGGTLSTFNAFEGRGGDDQIFGNGATRAEYTGATAGVTVDLAAGMAWGDASVGTDTLFGVTQVRASSFDDTLLGSNFFSDETFDGRGGNDFIDGRAGFDRADYAFNGPAAVGIQVNLAAGTVVGDPVFTGSDTLRSIEAIRGTHRDDVYDARGFGMGGVNVGSLGTLNEFEGMAGDDTVYGNGNTRLTFVNAREGGIIVDLQAGTVEGGPSVGNDVLMGGINAMRGSVFGDVFMGTNNGIVTAEIYEGLGGNDTFIGRGGVDRAIYSSPGSSGITVTMATAEGSNIGSVVGDPVAVGTDKLIDIAFVTGTFFDDIYNASGYSSGVTGLGTFNEFEGLGGNDHITGNGNTRVSYLSSFDPVTVDLDLGTASSMAVGTDTLVNVFSVRGSNNADALRGSQFDDTFEGRGGNDFINGRGGFDLVRYDNGSTAGGTFIANAAGGFTASAGGHDSDTLVNIEAIRGTNFGDVFFAIESGVGYRFEARGGDDILFGSQGNDTLLGEDGNDLLRGGLGADVLNGGAGSDRLDFNSLAEAGDTIQGFQTGFGGDVIDIADLLLDETGYAGGPVSAFVRIAAFGADGLLQINPTGSADPLDWRTLATIVGGAGLNADALVASGNLDVAAVAGETFIGTEFNDELFGGPGNDTLIGLLGNDLLRGGAGDDLLNGGIVADIQSDAGFRDTDRADYSTAPGPVIVNLAIGIAIDGTGGVDTLIGIESVNGSAFADTLTGADAFSENFHGGPGNDLIQGGPLNDRAEYNDATAGVSISLGSFSGGTSSTGTVSGDVSVGTDTVIDVEQFTGSEHADTFRVGGFQSASGVGGFFSSFNAFEGRGGDDTIIGNGSTRIDFNLAPTGVTVNFATGVATGDGTDTFSGVNSVRGSAHADTLLGGNPASDGFENFDGRGGNDWIDGGSGWDRADYAFNGAASMGITAQLAAGIVTGDPLVHGTDTLRGIESIRGTHLDDTLDARGFDGSSANAGSFGPSNELEGMAGNDIYYGNGSTSVVFFTAREGVSVDLGAGTVTGGASVGNDVIVSGVWAVRGSNFDDALVGSSGNNLLAGGNGNDVLRGGGGFDFLDGGPGSDRFDFDSPFDGVDTIQFFEAFPGGDVLDIGELLLNWTPYNGGAGGPLSDFVRLEVPMFGFTPELQIDVDGSAGPMPWQTLVVLQGAGGLTLETLLANGNLDVEAEVLDQVINGDDFDNNLEGGPGNDTINGFLGNDRLVGFAGNDTLNGGFVADFQSDVGFRDFDRADYSGAPGSINVNLLGGVATNDGYGSMDVLTGIEMVVGSMFPDVIVGGDAFSESYQGGGGDDFIDGGGGNDQVQYFDATLPLTITLGGMFGFDASGLVTGDPFTGTDTLLNVERVVGSNAADTYTVQLFLSNSQPGGFASAFNAFEGRGGNDVISGNGATRIEYTGATASVTVDLDLGEASAADGSVGVDDILGGVNSIRASSHADFLFGNGFDNIFDGRGGNDEMDGRGGFDRADYAFNGPASVGLMVNLAAGTVVGDPVFSGTDTLRSIEAIRGTHLGDTYDARGFSGLSTNAGSLGTLNEFEGMAGDDIVWGNGNTRLTFANAREGVIVDLQAGTVEGGPSVGNDTLMGGINQMRGSNFDDTFKGTNHGVTSAQVYEGRAGDDRFEGRGGFDQARYDSDPTQTGIHVDMTTAGGSNVGTVTGDLWIGTDTLVDIVSVVGTWFNDVYDATDYFSPVSTLGAFNEFEGLGGDDHITGNGATRVSYISAGSGVAVQLGTSGNASGLATGFDTLINVFSVRGSNFADTLIGSIGDDTFEGRGGNDTIDGRGGFDLVRYDNGSNGPGSFIVDHLGRFTATAGGHGTDTLLEIESIRGTNFGDTFDGSASSLGFTFDGRGGNDSLTGSLGNDTLRGGTGADFLDGGAGSDTFDFDHLNEAGDTIANFQAGLGGDVLDIADLLAASTGYAGGAIADYVRVEASGPDGLLQIDPDGATPGQTWQTLATLLGGAGLNVASLLANGNLEVGVAAGVTVTGTPGNDFLEGGEGNDTLLGLAGHDTLRGNAGDDVLNGGIIADLQSDAGFRDNDRVDYSTSPAGVVVNLQTGTASDGWGGTDELTGIEAVTGSAFNDTIVGADDTFSESFRGGAGNDFIDGGGGNDLAEYWDATGPLNVSLGGPMGGSGGEVSGASVGTDTLLDVERVMGSDFADIFNSFNFSSASAPGGFMSRFNAFEGRGGDDLIFGNGATRAEYTGASAGVTVDLAAGMAWGNVSVGTDTLSGVNQVRGSSFVDMLFGSQFDDTFDGRAGNDQIDGRGGFDRADYAFNGPASVGLMVNLAAGTVVGDPTFSGSDTLTSIEAIRGTHLADTYNAIGFSGSFGTLNEFEGMAGNDTVWGNGNTRLSFANAREHGIVVDLLAGTVEGGPSVGNDMLMGGVNSMRGSNFDDTFRGTSNGTVTAEIYEGLGGNDTFEGRGGVDRAIYNSPGSTGIAVTMATVEGSNIGSVVGDPVAVGTDKLIDIAFVTGTFLNDTYNAIGYFSPVTGLGSFNEFEGGLGDDVIIGNGDTRVSFIGAGAGVNVDLAAGTASGAGSGNDTVINVTSVRGSNFGDTLLGTESNDTFEGRGGNDLIDGRSGIDLVRYDNGSTGGGSFVVNAAGGFTAIVPGHDTDELVNIESIRGTNFGDHYDATGFAGPGWWLSVNNLFEGRGGDDTIIGNGGTQVLYDGAGSGVTVDLATGTASGATTGNDTLINVFAVRGTNFADTLIGSAADDILEGGAGDDTLDGSHGNDTLLGGEGNDLLRGGPGNDVLDGGSGSDTFDFDSHLQSASISAFEAGPGGDVLDIADLLYSSTSYGGGAGGPLSDFVRLVLAGDIMRLQIDTDGSGGSASWQDLVGIVGGTELELNRMLSDGNLDILI